MPEKKQSTRGKQKYTLVGEFKGRSIFIEGNLAQAKEFSEYMTLGWEALNYLENMPSPLDSIIKANGKSTRKTKSN